MQDKMMYGFKEAHRILKPSGLTIYNMSLVDDYGGDNTKKWSDLYLSLDFYADSEKLRDLSQWLDECKKAGFSQNKSTKIYGEKPAPYTDVFPFENQILRWMACYVFASGK